MIKFLCEIVEFLILRISTIQINKESLYSLLNIEVKYTKIAEDFPSLWNQ